MFLPSCTSRHIHPSHHASHTILGNVFGVTEFHAFYKINLNFNWQKVRRDNSMLNPHGVIISSLTNHQNQKQLRIHRHHPTPTPTPILIFIHIHIIIRYLLLSLLPIYRRILHKIFQDENFGAVLTGCQIHIMNWERIFYFYITPSGRENLYYVYDIHSSTHIDRIQTIRYLSLFYCVTIYLTR